MKARTPDFLLPKQIPDFVSTALFSGLLFSNSYGGFVGLYWDLWVLRAFNSYDFDYRAPLLHKSWTLDRQGFLTLFGMENRGTVSGVT